MSTRSWQGRRGRRQRLSRALKLTAVVLAVLAVIYVAASVYIARSALSAEITPLAERPSDLGLAYEEVEFAPRGWPELRLRGWWMPAPDQPQARGTVIRVHGLDSNRGSLLGLSAALVRAGYSVLAFDLRGHGESDEAQMGAGLRERDDVLGAVDYVIQERDAQPGAIVLHGNSYGGATVLMAGWREPAVAGVFADSAFASLSDLVSQEVARRTVLPLWLAEALRPGVVLAGRWLYGINIGSVEPASDAAQYQYPLGLTHCRPDERIPLSHYEQIRTRVQLPPLERVFEDCGHSDAWLEYRSPYEAMLIGYLESRLGR